KVNGVFILFTSYMIPQALVFSRYYRLATFIKRQGHHPPGGLTSSFVSKNRTKIIKMLIIIAVLFSLAWLPYFVLLVGAIKTLRTVTNLFLTNLAVSDLILVSLILPLQVNNISHTDEYIESDIHCKLARCLPVLSISCSIYIMVALAEERYRGKSDSWLVLVQLTLAVFSTSYNIVVYLIYIAEFRKSFLSIFCCVRPPTVHPSLPLGLPVTPDPSTVHQNHLVPR
ncbi:hypothetical protein LSAT2_023459, partial [Lamellibrachia satsuma]